MRVLVVDDEASVRGVVSEVLTDDGYDVTEAVDGAEALELFQKQPFPIVISDIRMPGLNGIELLQAIKEIRANTQVIIMTSHSSVDSTIDSIRSGAHSYLIKPFEDLDAISEGVKKAVEKLELLSLRILVVDDEESVRNIVSEVLTDEGHKITQAASGEEAIKLFRKYPYSLVITDIRMPGMSGMELLESIKELSENTEVVIMTSHASLDTAVDALRTGAFDYLMKPFDELEAISSMVNRAIDKLNQQTEKQVQVTELKEKNEELEQVNTGLKAMAQHDELTGLFNRRYFREAIDKEISRAIRHKHPFSLIFLDIDFFKQYNDSHGHPAGDKALRMLAMILRNRARKSDLVVRYGGEEFVLLLPETDADGARRLADIIRRSVEAYPFPGRSSQPDGKLTISLGIASCPHDGRDADTLIERADKALYDAKHTGRNTVRLAVAG